MEHNKDQRSISLAGLGLTSEICSRCGNNRYEHDLKFNDCTYCARMEMIKAIRTNEVQTVGKRIPVKKMNSKFHINSPKGKSKESKKQLKLL